MGPNCYNVKDSLVQSLFRAEWFCSCGPVQREGNVMCKNMAFHHCQNSNFALYPRIPSLTGNIQIFNRNNTYERKNRQCQCTLSTPATASQ